MIRGIFCVMITCWATVAVAQQFYFTLGAGSRITNTGIVQIDSIRLEIINPRDENYLVPGTGLKLESGSGWIMDFNLRIQSGGLSLSVTEQPSSICTQCTIRKGMLISYHEMMTAATVGYTILSKGNWQLQLHAGLTWNYRFNVRQSPVKDLTWLSRDGLKLLNASSAMIVKNYWNTIVVCTVTWKKWSLGLEYINLLNDSVTGNFTFKGTAYLMRTGQQMRILSLKYRWLSI